MKKAEINSKNEEITAVKRPRLARKGPQKEKIQWLVSSFADRKEKGTSRVAGKGRKLNETDQRSSLPWTEKYQPKTRADLAVHTRKVQEVFLWLGERILPKAAKARGPILLLTGPPGCGKAATVHVLSQEMHLSVNEWITPVRFDLHCGLEGHRPDDMMLFTESQTEQFQRFLFRLSKFNSLVLGPDSSPGLAHNPAKLILVKEIPNVFMSRPESFHRIIRRYHCSGQCPLVFVLSEGSRGRSVLRHLFPDLLQRELKIDTITFNPVNRSSLVKALLRIASLESQSLGKECLTKSDAERMADSCGGDIRSGVNAMQMVLLGQKASVPSSDRGHKRNKSKQTAAAEQDAFSGIGRRDSSLFLFRALGKVLYCKRRKGSAMPECEQLPSHLFGCARLPLQCNPEEIVERSQISSQLFTLYLHQNYLDFFDEVDKQGDVISYFSDADTLLGNWAGRNELEPYASSLVCRGLMFSNHPAGSGSHSWKPLKKPAWLEVVKKAAKNATYQHFYMNFKSGHLQQKNEVLTEILPYLAKVGIAEQSPDLFQLLRGFFEFDANFTNRFSLLKEKDITDQSEDITAIPVDYPVMTQSQNPFRPCPPHKEPDSEDDLVIEEYDSE